MTDNVTIWKTLVENLPKRTWIPISEILETVQTRVHLDSEDLERHGSRSESPQWESNVRRLLHTKSRTGSLRARKTNRKPE